MNRSRGFTLIELLVVIAIIAILASLAGGGLARGKQTARRVACIHNLKQWGQATFLYAGDSDDELPREAAFDGINPWQVTSLPFAADVWYNALPSTIGVAPAAKYAETPSSQQDFYARGNIFHCPAARFAPVSATYPNFSLAMNSKLMMDFESAPSPVGDLSTMRTIAIGQVKVPSKTALFLDAGVPGETTVCEFQPAYLAQPKAYASEFSGRHSAGGNIVFFGGNVATLKASDVIDMDPASPRRGGGIYPPRQVIWRHDPALIP